MSESDLAIVAALVFAWGTLSARLERFDVTAPIIFVLAGVLLTHGPLAVLSIAPAPELVKALAEVTLVLVLFSDASRVGMRELRRDAGIYARLLGIGLPLTLRSPSTKAFFRRISTGSSPSFAASSSSSDSTAKAAVGAPGAR